MQNNILKIIFFLTVSLILLIPENLFFINTTSNISFPKQNNFSLKKITPKNILSINVQQTSINDDIIEIKSTKIRRKGKVENIVSRKVNKINYDDQKNETGLNKFSNSSINNENNLSGILYKTGRYLRFYFDNDIFNNTDYYYTNGIKFELIDPIFSYSPLMRFLLPYPGNSSDYFGISLVQNMYTPTNPDLGEIMINDRPFAAYLYLGHFKISNDALNKIRFTSGIDIGVIGQNSLGGYFQHAVHDHEPLGWKHQVQNDILINYKIEIEKGLLSIKYFEFNGMAKATLGSVYTNASVGFTSRFGKISPYFEDIDITPYSKYDKTGAKFRYYFFVKGQANFIAYDATLQGGAINRNSIYTISNEMINRNTFQASAGFVFAYKIFSFEYEQFFMSREFTTARNFMWGSIKTSFSI